MPKFRRSALVVLPLGIVALSSAAVFAASTKTKTAPAAVAEEAAVPAAAIDSKLVLSSYVELVYRNYKDAYDDAVALDKAIDKFLAQPTDLTLKAAKEAWLKARESYGQTEAFRFYEGPIDFVNQAQGTEGPEGFLNAWPLNEAYIDYVQGNLKAGIINEVPPKPITKKRLIERNQAEDEADVATGYHAIEFLLWGQDLSSDTPGTRPIADYITKAPANITAVERRRTYLKTVADLLVDDLKFLVDSWEPGKDNYARQWAGGNDNEHLSQMLTGIATLSGFELASERMGTSLDSGDQEDEHSCFSDNTHNDFIYNAKGIANVYFGQYRDYKGKASLDALLAAKDKKLAAQVAKQLKETERLMAAIPFPIDREVLSTPKGSKGREAMEKAVASLQKQADLFKKAGEVLGLKVEVVSE
ncbi:MAG: putative iron-regulated protein [Rickettsiales bacterium]|jgi:putative iron-regulated protein|nr:putative iron-regulated protein [Rickettsiales bacterium]